MTSKGSFYIAFLCAAFIVSGCAKVGTPTGGPKDVTPPRVVESTPAMNSTNFKGKKIEIKFDEFIQLIDINKNFVMSPPLKKKPMVMLRNKSIVVDLEEELQPNTTYRMYFSKAIVDNNEKNPLKNYEFVFSTGNVVDSLSLRGRVIDAFDHKTDKDGFFVMLYNKFQDSIPRKQLPQYITKTDENGWFSLTHIRPDTFMIFALKDMNMNTLFDMPNEPIAFSDSLLHFNSKNYFMPDSLVKPDSSALDSTERGPFKAQIKLFSFTESHKKQYLKKFQRLAREKFDLLFNTEPDTLQIQPINFTAKNWLEDDRKSLTDSISFWITDTSLVFKDTLKVRLGFSAPDSLGNMVPKYDTISLSWKKPVGAKGKQKALSRKTDKLEISANIKSQPTLDLNRNIDLQFNHPLQYIDSTRISLYKVTEKAKSPLKYYISHDTVWLRKFSIHFKLEPQTDYLLVMDTLAFKDLYGSNNDSTGYKFRTQKDDYYGKIKLNVENVNEQMIIQLLSEQGAVVTQKVIDKSGLVVFDYLNPGKYKIKAIYDHNGNKKWDTGDFALRIQPERVAFYLKTLALRSNWEMEETWKLE